MGIKFYNQLWSLDPPFYVLGLHFYQQSPSAGMGGWLSRLLFKFCLHYIFLPLKFPSSISLTLQTMKLKL